MALWGKTDAGISRPKFLDVGQVKKINITNGGAGFDTVPGVAIAAAPNGGVDATATAVLTGGVVTAINITNPGAGYTSAPAISFTGGTPETPAEATAIIAPIVYNNSDIYFVDSTEAGVGSNKDRGISTAGWYHIKTYTDAQSVSRVKTELLVAMSASQTQALAGDASDDVLVDDFEIVITEQPQDAIVLLGDDVQFTVDYDLVGNSSGSTVSIQWQRLIADTWTNLTNGAAYSGVTGFDLTVLVTEAGDDNAQFRAVITEDLGKATAVTSDVATLSVTE